MVLQQVLSGFVHLLSGRLIKMWINFPLRQILALFFISVMIISGSEAFTVAEYHSGKWKIVSDQVRLEGSSSVTLEIT